MSTIDIFEQDLLDCGVPYSEIQPLGMRYVRALETNSHIDWIELYVGIFATLRHSLHQTRAADGDALQRLLLLVNDDLGAQLFSEDARNELAQNAGEAVRYASSASTSPFGSAKATYSSGRMR